jgi:hypothetical protein
LFYLQVADYFAYSVNRDTNNSGKKQKTRLDIKVLNSLALGHQFSDGITIVEADPTKNKQKRRFMTMNNINNDRWMEI